MASLPVLLGRGAQVRRLSGKCGKLLPPSLAGTSSPDTCLYETQQVSFAGTMELQYLPVDATLDWK